MVVDPVVISTTGFVVNYSVILETVLFQPRLGDFGVLTQTTSEDGLLDKISYLLGWTEAREIRSQKKDD